MGIEGGADIKRARALLQEAAQALNHATRAAREHRGRAKRFLGEVQKEGRKSLH